MPEIHALFNIATYEVSVIGWTNVYVLIKLTQKVLR